MGRIGPLWTHRVGERMWLRHLTLAYVGALVVLALLAIVAYYLPYAELQAQQSSAAMLNLIDRQATLLERSALLAELLVHESNAERQQTLRAELLDTVQRMLAAQRRLARAQQQVRFAPELDRQVRDYIAAATALAESPIADPVAAQALAAQALGTLADALDMLAREYQLRDEAGVRALRRQQAGTLVATLATIAMIGLFVFRPMVRWVRQEHEQRIHAERLAVVGTMAAKLAHEIRNPLGSIRLNLDSLGENLTAPHAPALLASIDSEVRRIQRISDSYLRFARLPPVMRSTVVLNDWLTRQLEFCAAELARRRIELRRQFADDLPPVQVDTEQLWEAILNLVRNAWEAMPNGGILTVGTARVGRWVEITIADTGQGMSAAELARIWEPFFSTKASGTGLGLLLVRQIVAEHGGVVHCESAPGCGTTFRIRLPLQAEAANVA